MLTLTRREEEQVRKMAKDAGLKACQLPIQGILLPFDNEGCVEFAACAQGRLVSVAWKCRDKHKAMNHCLAAFAKTGEYDKIRRDFIAAKKAQRAAEAEQVAINLVLDANEDH